MNQRIRSVGQIIRLGFEKSHLFTQTGQFSVNAHTYSQSQRKKRPGAASTIASRSSRNVPNASSLAAHRTKFSPAMPGPAVPRPSPRHKYIPDIQSKINSIHSQIIQIQACPDLLIKLYSGGKNIGLIQDNISIRAATHPLEIPPYTPAIGSPRYIRPKLLPGRPLKNVYHTCRFHAYWSVSCPTF